jgi:hypothetical protein
MRAVNMYIRNNMSRAFGIIVPGNPDNRDFYPPIMLAPNETKEVPDAAWENTKANLAKYLKDGDLEIVKK